MWLLVEPVTGLNRPIFQIICVQHNFRGIDWCLAGFRLKGAAMVLSVSHPSRVVQAIIVDKKKKKAHQSGQRMQPFQQDPPAFRDSRLINPVGFHHLDSSNDDVGYAFDTYRCVGHVCGKNENMR
jgi:hypothetical protein